MKISLSRELQAHRHGRFLTSLLGLDPRGVKAELGFDAAPGLLLMTGAEFAAAIEAKPGWMVWARQAGNALLLLPPFDLGAVYNCLDWDVRFLAEAPLSIDAGDLTKRLAPETSYCICGLDGASDRELGHLWQDGTVNTRYWKSHSNSGLVAATTLPLWSISLMGSGELVHAWLFALCQHAGKAMPAVASSTLIHEFAPSKGEWAVMVCCFAYQVSNLETLRQVLRAQAVQTMRVEGFDLVQVFNSLSTHGLLAEKGLSDKGLDLLVNGPYWCYAEQLKGAS